MQFKLVDLSDLVVPYDLAVLARDKGYDSGIYDFMYENIKNNHMTVPDWKKVSFWRIFSDNEIDPKYVLWGTKESRHDENLIAAPTTEQLAEWIRINFRFDINPFHEMISNKWGYTGYDFFESNIITDEIVDDKSMHGELSYDTRKEAMIAALTEFLTNIETYQHYNIYILFKDIYSYIKNHNNVTKIYDENTKEFSLNTDIIARNERHTGEFQNWTVVYEYNHIDLVFNNNGFNTEITTFDEFKELTEL